MAKDHEVAVEIGTTLNIGHVIRSTAILELENLIRSQVAEQDALPNSDPSSALQRTDNRDDRPGPLVPSLAVLTSESGRNPVGWGSTLLSPSCLAPSMLE